MSDYMIADRSSTVLRSKCHECVRAQGVIDPPGVMGFDSTERKAIKACQQTECPIHPVRNFSTPYMPSKGDLVKLRDAWRGFCAACPAGPAEPCRDRACVLFYGRLDGLSIKRSDRRDLEARGIISAAGAKGSA
jgi:hypothetical protein